jgi:hypothetical protein
MAWSSKIDVFFSIVKFGNNVNNGHFHSRILQNIGLLARILLLIHPLDYYISLR